MYTLYSYNILLPHLIHTIIPLSFMLGPWHLQTLNFPHKLDELGHRLTETSFWSVDEGKKLSRDSVGREVIHREFPIPILLPATDLVVL